MELTKYFLRAYAWMQGGMHAAGPDINIQCTHAIDVPIHAVPYNMRRRKFFKCDMQADSSLAYYITFRCFFIECRY